MYPCTESVRPAVHPWSVLSRLLQFALAAILVFGSAVGCSKDEDGGAVPPGNGGGPGPGAEDPLEIKHKNSYPTRLARRSDGKLYVTDVRVGSVFIYDPDLSVVAELKGLDQPIGLAVDGNGYMYVGNDGRDNVEVYTAAGEKIVTVDDGNLSMPNGVTLDNNGNIYVVDSLAHQVKVYDALGKPKLVIGGPGDDDGELKFPVAAVIVYRTVGGNPVSELYVADQEHAKIQVFGLDGTFLRSFGGPIVQQGSGWDWQGKFGKVQSLAWDAQGRLHALDNFLNKVQILDPDTGAYLDSYGSFGLGLGELNVPLDIVITSAGKVVVANAENGRVEEIYEIP